MKMAKVYIAAPVALNWGTVLKFRDKLKSPQITINLWERDGRYSDSWLDNSDAVVFLLPDLKWSCQFNELPIGLKRELSRAYAQNKRIFIGYKNAQNEINFYDASIIYGNGTLDGLSGKVGSSQELKWFLKTVINGNGKQTVNDTSGSMWETKNPCNEIELEKIPSHSHNANFITFKNPDYIDERLLLML